MDDKMIESKTKLNKPLILFIFTIIVSHSSISSIKENFHIEPDLKQTFIDGGVAGTAAMYFMVLILILGSFLSVFFIKKIWNGLMPSIANLKSITYWEAMGLMTIVLLATYF